jgi:hypothetical protein
MGNNGKQDVRAALVELLISKVEEDQYPSSTTMNMLEELLTPEEVPRYAEVLMRKVARDDYPSVPMMARLKKLA